MNFSLFTSKKLLTFLLFFGGTLLLIAQIPGIPYQAYIQNKGAGFIPGEQYQDLPLAMTDIILEFDIQDSNGVVEYTERIPAKTDEFGLVSTVIGAGVGTVTYGSFDTINWDGKKKTMDIRIDMTGTATSFENHGQLDLVYTPGPAYGISRGTGAPTATSPANPNAGDVYVDESTGDVYAYDGTNWIPQSGVTTTTGTGMPTATSPANPTAGDIYVDESTGDLYTYNSTTNTWESQSEVVSTDADNIIIEGTGGLAYLNDAALGLSTGTGAPTATSPASPTAGDIYVDESTGDVYGYDGTTWTKTTPPTADVTSSDGSITGVAANSV
ncbi:MAG: hypothetical protein VWZ86_06310, partial [Flavobacteriaceae bacterium]